MEPLLISNRESGSGFNERYMRLAGRVNLMVLAVIIGFVGIAFLLLGGKSTPTAVTNDFLTALAKGNVDQLVKLSYYSPEKEKQYGSIRDQWTFATQKAGPYYSFFWHTKEEKMSDDNDAGVQIDFTRNARNPGSYSENYEIPLIKTNGTWKVDVSSINRELFPALPK